MSRRRQAPKLSTRGGRQRLMDRSDRSDRDTRSLVSRREPFRDRYARDRESGQATIEFALILIPLLILVGGIIYFGIGLNYWLDMNRVANQGARWAAVNNWAAAVHDAETILHQPLAVLAAAAPHRARRAGRRQQGAPSGRAPLLDAEPVDDRDDLLSGHQTVRTPRRCTTLSRSSSRRRTSSGSCGASESRSPRPRRCGWSRTPTSISRSTVDVMLRPR